MQCARCGAGVNPAGIGPNQAPLCEACKWAAMSHQPVSGPSTVGFGAAGATAGVAVPTYSSAQAHLGQPSHVDLRLGNLLGSLLCAVAASLVLGGGLYGFVVATGFGPWWMFILLGWGTGTAAVVGNDRLVTANARWIGGAVALVASMLVLYVSYRHSLIVGLEKEGITARLPLILKWKQITFLFSHADGWSWWLLAIMATVAGAFPTGRRSRRAHR